MATRPNALGESLQNCLANICESGESSQNCLANVSESGESTNEGNRNVGEFGKLREYVSIQVRE
jgi:hypothetical protein